MNDPKYIAGLEAAAGICENESDKMGECSASIKLIDCADAIRAAIEQSQPQEVQATNRETLADIYIRASGKKIHASDCATSVAPAMEPGPCDCDVPQEVQPVAWLITWPKGTTMVKDADVSVHQYIAIGCTADPLYTHPYDPAAIQAAGFAGVEDLLAAWQGAQKDAARIAALSTAIGNNDDSIAHYMYRYFEEIGKGMDNITKQEWLAAVDYAIAAAPAPENKNG